jgi:NTE family protein
MRRQGPLGKLPGVGESTTSSDSSAADPALPRSFDARYGKGIGRALSLGGGGMYFVAWQLGYLKSLADHGIRIDRADRVVGTSAGSVVAATVAHERLRLTYAETTLMSRLPGLIGKLFPSQVALSSQQRALDLYMGASDSAPSTVRSIGHAALAAVTPSAETMPRDLELILGEHWSSDALWMTCTDAYTADRCVMTRVTSVSVARGAAASSAVPGIFAPQVIAGRKCIDGGVGGTAVHLDLVAGADKALVLSLYRDTDLTRGMLTLAPGDLGRELVELKASGTEVFFRAPETHPMDVHGLMDPTAVPEAMAQGSRQGTEDVESGGLSRFWG